MAKKSNISTNIAIGANLSGLTRGLKIASSKMRRFGSQAKSLGTTLSRGISAPLIGLGALSVKTFSGFEAEMSKVKAVSGATADQFNRLKAQAKKLGSTTTFTATEVAGLQTEFAKLGFTANEIDKVTESTLYLAQAGGAELARAAEVAGATLRAFGLEATETSRVTDVMAKSFATSSLDMESFAEAMKTTAPIAKATGVSLEEASAMLGALANNGIKGSIAGTALKKILSELHQEGKPMRQTFRELARQNLNLAQANDLVGERAKGALMILTQQMGTVDELTESYNNAQGAAAGMAAEMMDNTAGAFKELQSATEGALIELGDAITDNKIFKDVLKGLTRTMGTITEAISKMSDAELYNKVVLGALLAVVPLVIAAVGSLTIAFGSLTAAMGPVSLALAGVTALYLALRKEVDKTQEAVDNAISGDNAEESLQKLQVRFDALSESIKKQKKFIEDYKSSYNNPLYDVEDTKRYKELNDALEGFRKKQMQVAIGMTKIRDAQKDANIVTQTGTENQKNNTNALNRTSEAFVNLENKQISFTAECGKGAQMLDVVGDSAVEVADDMIRMEGGVTAGISALQKMRQQSESLKSGIQALGNMLQSSLISAFDILNDKDEERKWFEPIIEGFKRMALQIAATAMAAAALAAILAAITGVAPMSKAALTISGAFGGGGFGDIFKGVAQGLSGIPFLAEGGIVTAPTLAMIGEGGESEAVIPLSKLPQIAGGNGGAVEVYGRLSGQDILLSTEKANRTRSRYRGF